MSIKKYITANEAVAHAARLARVEVVAAYPVTPQTTIVEKISGFIASGEMDAEFIKVESEHSALTACMGARMAGVRSFTSTSSQGLEYMHEMLAYASGGRYPLVLVDVTRSVALPWSIWGDHQDAIQQRDTGWIQIFTETGQEAMDMVLQAYRIAEDRRILLPVMVCLDGFIQSHTEELVDIPDQGTVDSYLPPYEPVVTLDVDNPYSISIGGFGRYYAAWRKEQQEAMDRARQVIVEAGDDFARIFGRHYGGLIEQYRCEGAEAIILTMGAFTGTAREVVDEMRADGKAVGLIKVRAYRPFPVRELRQALSRAKAAAVLDRDCSWGCEGALATDLKAALYSLPSPPTVLNFVGGLGGSDVPPEQMKYMLDKALSVERGAPSTMEFIGL
ncbi:MAG TPA: pyruvate ferredoxin oxidoreductase [Dehalococcoidia bacterium]|nr:pyruvate ferredoxin oxidoreductase [Dehalococcoidia bacterium]